MTDHTNEGVTDAVIMFVRLPDDIQEIVIRLIMALSTCYGPEKITPTDNTLHIYHKTDLDE